MVAAARIKRPLRNASIPRRHLPGDQSLGAWLMRLLYRTRSREAKNCPRPVPRSLPSITCTCSILLPWRHRARQIITLAASKWYNNLIVGSILRLAGVIFVRRGEVDREALRQCLDVLHNGGVLAIAPEGTRSRTGGLQEAKAGIASGPPVRTR